ncbi:FAD-binding monooxygenase, partial [Nonomuraea helvata]
MKRTDPAHDITVYERNPAGSTYGWGVTYWDELLSNLYFADPESAQIVRENSIRWDSWVAYIHERATVTANDSDVGYGIGRHQLLAILAERARSLGVRIEYEHEITHEDEL